MRNSYSGFVGYEGIAIGEPDGPFTLVKESTMNVRFALIALVSAISLPALATSGITMVPGEPGFTTHAMPSTVTRAEVIKEGQAWARNPVTADGWREVGGEAGRVFVGTSASGKTRAAVVEELVQAKRNPVSADGWLDVGGEAGAVYVGTSSHARRAASAGNLPQARAGMALGGRSDNGQQSGPKNLSSHGHR